MAFNKESNGYILSFSAVLVIVVGSLLAFVSSSLKPIQKENVKNEKKQYILKAIKDTVSRAEARLEFDKIVKRRVVLNYNGEIISDLSGEIDELNKDDAFNIDLLKEYKGRPVEERNYPLFVCENKGKKFYVIPTMGSGLWAAVWGFIGFDENFNAIYAAVFDHKSETPGLGAEISKDFFGAQFEGKTIIDESGKFVSIAVVKPGTPLNEHMVDGIAGGTFTSVGVDEMLKRTAKVYVDFFKNNSNF